MVLMTLYCGVGNGYRCLWRMLLMHFYTYLLQLKLWRVRSIGISIVNFGDNGIVVLVVIVLLTENCRNVGALINVA